MSDDFDKRCETCQHFYKGSPRRSNWSGECRRFPPTYLPGSGPQVSGSAWPELSDGDWCGEWSKQR